MQSQPDLLLERADQAMARQSWREAWALLEQISPEYQGSSLHLGARRQDFMLLAAHCLRHRGQFKASESLYDELIDELSLSDPRLAEALSGKGETLHAQNRFGDSLQLLRAAVKVPGQDSYTRLRVLVTQAHIYSHVDVQKSIDLFEDIIRQFPRSDDAPGANLRFSYGDALLIAGDFQAAESEILIAREISQETGCAVTLADCMRRLPLLRALRGDTTRTLTDLADMGNASELYRASGDRGEAYLHTERGEVLRSLGRLREAEAEFNRGLWASREIGDRNRQGHNLLGLFETSRASGRPKFEHLDQANLDYEKSRSEWGRLHVLIARAIADRGQRDEILLQARELVEQSESAPFNEEKRLLQWLRSAPEDQVQSLPHLMNYP